MNTTLNHPVHVGHSHPPEELLVRRVSLVDRAALHLGLALVKWGRRPLERETRERRARRVENALAQLAREQSAQNLLGTAVPKR